jgi:hypothetical protein
MGVLTDLTRKVYAVLRDSEKAFVIQEEVEDWINEAIVDLNSRLRILRKETTGTTSSTGTITLPTDYVETVWLSVLPSSLSDAQTVVEFTNDEVFDSYRLPAKLPANQLARVYGGTLETYPVVESQAYTWRYVYKPPVLDSAADSTTLPAELDVRIVNYARAHGKYKEGEIDEGDRYLALYESYLPSPSIAGLRERPGKLGLVPVPGVFDG